MRDIGMYIYLTMRHIVVFFIATKREGQEKCLSKNIPAISSGIRKPFFFFFQVSVPYPAVEVIMVSEQFSKSIL